LTSSWIGSYNWTGGILTKTTKVAPPGVDTDTLIVTDNFNCLQDSFIITKSLQLPVELIQFSAQRDLYNNVLLKWITAIEYKNAYYSVEWSLDGINFNNIGVVIGNGTTNLQHTYQLIHQFPEFGNNYYRLKLVDTDSSFSYSTIIPVFVNAQINPITKNNFIVVFPNPSNTGEFNIDYYSLINKCCSVKVYNILGKLVYTDNWNISSGISHFRLRLSDVQKGIYLLNIDNEIVKIQK
jgi:hypothetical protein